MKTEEKKENTEEEEKVCPLCGFPLSDPFVCDYCDWGKGGEA